MSEEELLTLAQKGYQDTKDEDVKLAIRKIVKPYKKFTSVDREGLLQILNLLD